MIQVGVIGAGQMGSQIGKVSSEDHDVIYYDIDGTKGRRAAIESHARFEDEIEEVLKSHVIFLAVPKDGVTDLLKRYHAIVSRDTLWVNISTFVTLKEMMMITGDVSNIVSCKIIYSKRDVHKIIKSQNSEDWVSGLHSTLPVFINSMVF